MNELYSHGEVHVVQDPVIKEVGNTKVASIVGMTVESIGTGDTKKDIFSYFDFEVWDKAAEYIEKNLKKGDKFIVHSATPRQNRWEKDGEKHSKIVFRVRSFRVHSGKDSKENA